ncbi:MAG: type II secretion system minor pseudopilin GspH [Aeromonas sp.]
MKTAPSAHRCAGFTLLELLLVTILMGLVATAVTLSLGSAKGDRALDEQARRLIATLQLAQEYAVMDGRLVGLRIDEHGWQFMQRQLKDRQWQALTDDKQLGPVTLPSHITLTLTLEGFGWLPDADSPQDLRLNSQQDTQKSPNLPPPQVLILPGGELSPFEITFTQQDGEVHYLRQIRGNELGHLSLLSSDDHHAAQEATQ